MTAIFRPKSRGNLKGGLTMLYTILVVLAIIALVLFIFRGRRRA